MIIDLYLSEYKAPIKWKNLKFHENSSNGSQAVPCGCMDRRTNMTKLIVTFHNFANVPKNGTYDILVSTYLELEM